MFGRGFQLVELVTSLALMLLATAVLWLLFPGLKSQDAAAWVQAIGSIGAIIGAVWVSNIQQWTANKYLQDKDLKARTIAAQSLCTLGYWALEMMRRALNHGETDGAHGTSTFTAERLDHVRELIEKFVDPADSFTSTVALIFIHRIWEAKQSFEAIKNNELRDNFIKSIADHIDEMNKQLVRLIKHKCSLEADCYERGIINE